MKDDLDAAWAARPIELWRAGASTILVLEDAGGEPLQALSAMEAGSFLRQAIRIAVAVGSLHRHGLVHKDLKPANILLNRESGDVRLTGFGIASHLSHPCQSPDPRETIVGTLAYMAPEQTGRMNRPVDARSDLYALGVTYYQMLTGALPFAASDPMDWVHCHLARLPVPPSERVPQVPNAISAVVMKLLAKTPEERYQTAAGLEADLRHALAQWESQGHIETFPLAARDVSGQLCVPDVLYGRERELGSLQAAFHRVAAAGGPELVLVAGQAGVGKSVVVEELRRAPVPSNGLFASGKFDQYTRDVPYASLAQALLDLIRPLLGKSETELAPWRAALIAALGPNGGLMVTLLPELELLTGPQLPVPELPPRDAQRRFQLVFRRLLGVFAGPEHPLALFLDDLQWLDEATLDLLEDLLTQPELKYLLLIGAYREDEVDPAHPLMRRLSAIRQASGRVQQIVLKPLGLKTLSRMVADALHSDGVSPLARLIYQKTAGNPFFAIQFLTALVDEGLLTVDRDAASWTWDLERIGAKGYTDNVVDLVLGKLRRLPPKTLAVVKRLGCLGNGASLATLCHLEGHGEDALHATLWPAVRAKLLLRQQEVYRFLHDRVREAAYALIPEDERAIEHLAIGRRLAAQAAPRALEESVFEIVGQLNRGATLMTSGEERERLAELNLVAGRRAKSSSAYASALTYFTAGAALLAEDAWQSRHDLAFALELNRAECEFLTGALTDAAARLAELADRAIGPSELADLARLRVDLFMTLGRSDRAVTVGLECLLRFGIAWPAHPTKDEVGQEYAQLWRQLGDRPIEALLDLPQMVDPVACAIMEVLTSLVTPALWTDENLRCLLIGRMGNISLEYGNSIASGYAYTAVGNVLGLYFGDYTRGFRFAQLGLDFVEQPGMNRLKARVYLAFGNLAKPSARHGHTGRPLARDAFESAQQVADLTYAGISCNNLVTQLLATGAPLGDVQREAEAGLEFVRRARFGAVVGLIGAQLGLIRTLRGLTPVFGNLSYEALDEELFERQLEEGPGIGSAVWLYWIRKVQARVLADDHAAALAAAAKAERLLWLSPVIFERADYHFYAALALAALCATTPVTERSPYREAVAVHHRHLQAWAEHCPENFASRAALIGAEHARLEGRALDAERLYEQAIRAARDNACVHIEAIAYERAAAFYRERGHEQIAAFYLREARHGYRRWGADGKVRELDDMYSQLGKEARVEAPTSTIQAPVEHLELATVIKVSQAVSGEITVEKLIDRLMRLAMAQAGAGRALLILPRGAVQHVAAEATTKGENVLVHLHEEGVSETVLPVSVLHYVLRTRESVILEDAAVQSPFISDPYLRERQARSVLCLPLLNQSRLVGVLYFENNLAAHVFAPGRIAVLKLLASQAATALENTRLQAQLASERFRQVVESAPYAIVMVDAQGRIDLVNAQAERLFGFARAQLLGTEMEMLFPERLRQRHVELRKAFFEDPQPQPMDLRRDLIARGKDGREFPVEVGLSLIETDAGAMILFSIADISARERLVEELERKNNELEAFTYSVSHDLRAPLRGIDGFSQALLEDYGEQLDARGHRYLGRIRAAAQRMGGLIDDLTKLSRIDRVNVKRERIDFTEMARLVLADLASREPARAMPELDIAEGLTGEADARLLRIALENLLGNAWKFTSKTANPRIEFGVANVAQGRAFFTRDNGAGFDMAYADKLFGVFQRLHGQEEFPGTGIGLATVQRIIQRHGGRVWAEGRVGMGATFYFTI